MPFDRDITTAPDFIERQYRAGRNQTDLNVEMAERSFGTPSAFGNPLFGNGRSPYENYLATFQSPEELVDDPELGSTI